MGIDRKLSIYGKNTRENTKISLLILTKMKIVLKYLNQTRKYLNIIIYIIQNKNIVEYLNH